MAATNIEILVTEPHQNTMSNHDPDDMEMSSDESDEHKACRLFALKEHRRRSPSPEPHLDCTIEHVSADGNTKTIRLFYRADTYFNGIQNDNNQYLVSEIHQPYDTSLDIQCNEWIVVDINYNDLDIEDNYNYHHIQKQLNICNSEFCFPSRSTGYVIKIKRIRKTDDVSVQLVDDGLHFNDSIKIKFTQPISHFIEYETNKGLRVKKILSDKLKKYGIHNSEWRIIEIDGNHTILQHDTQTIETILNDKLSSHHKSYIITFKKHTANEMEFESKYTEMDTVSSTRQKYNELHGDWAAFVLQNVDHGKYYYSISDLNIKDIRKNNTFIVVPEGSLRARPNTVKISDNDKSHINMSTDATIKLSNDAMYEHVLLEKEAHIKKLGTVITETKGDIKTISTQLRTAEMKIKMLENDKQQLSEDCVVLKQQHALFTHSGFEEMNTLSTTEKYLREEVQKTNKEIEELKSRMNEEKSVWKAQEVTVFEAQCESMNAMKNAEIETLKSQKNSEIDALKDKIKELQDEYAEYKASDK